MLLVAESPLALPGSVLDIIDLPFVSPCFWVAFYSMFVHWHSPLLVWPWPTFYHCLLCVCGFLVKIRVHTQLFFIQSRTSSLLVSLMLWEVAGWVVSVVGSSLGLKLSVGCLFCDQKLFVPCTGIMSELAYRLGFHIRLHFCMTLWPCHSRLRYEPTLLCHGTFLLL